MVDALASNRPRAFRDEVLAGNLRLSPLQPSRPGGNRTFCDSHHSGRSRFARQIIAKARARLWKSSRSTVDKERHTRRKAMTHLVFRAVVATMLIVPFVAISYDKASAQERLTCSQALSHCGTQPVCQRRYEACIEVGCWTVGLIKRCGYEKR